MPEGDTVFLAGRRLDDALAGKELTRGELRHPRLIQHDLAGRTVEQVVSVGKHLFTRFDDGRSLHSHFRMDGSWHLYRPGRPWRGADHDIRAILATAERVAVGFRLHDLELLPTDEEDRFVGHLGPDLLGDGWDDAAAAEVLRRLRADPDRELGTALLDQRVACGVGNLYKAEICFLLKVSPWTKVGDLTEKQAVDAVTWSRKLLLRNAWRPEQSTTGDLGEGAQHWVFERGGRGCRRCRDVVQVARQDDGTKDAEDRVAYFCPTCQPGPHPELPRRGGRRRPQQQTGRRARYG
ncbi:DNA-formamidopyrimidine glycosylase family protein [Actinomycetospora termitidis]|uniref:DNA-(apurinic or apyrimidinic site) lyase n=1 Tax=Actinomycetospora termitidis TaxID=3053470 RepID=A0ABT7M6R7_9PSEU|nr:DNA-formamidopyrimidine glycosylase family protein [Actinomycetospora sp. Odt1-22]MDL5156360.1 DNA-formamidopyrimidine glycosylase family protein [Actinomycetospora sp. Odt1-22]